MIDSGDFSPPPASLFPDRGERERLDDWLTRELALAQERVVSGSVMPAVDIAQFREELARFDFKDAYGPDELLRWVIAQLEHGVVHMNHPRYFGLFNPAPNFPSQLADRVAASFNPQLASSGSSPVPVAIEGHLIRAIARRAGLPVDSGGHFTVGGSEANYTALICALTRANPEFANDGLRAFAGPPTMYTSVACQPAWFKIVHQAGLGRRALRLIPTDGLGRMNTKALQQAVAEDRGQGRIPVLISPTAGTTGAGMIDPLADCMSIAREHNVWCHVDAAWGGAALASERLRGLLIGIEQADSLTIDAHKWFATTMGCGMFITRFPAVLSEAFRASAAFMPSQHSGLDPYLNSVQWSRRFLGLRLFLSLGVSGWSGYAIHVERAVAVIDQARQLLLERNWSVVNNSKLAVLCALPPEGSRPVRDIARRVLDSGRAWVAVAEFEGRDVIRICATHGETTETDIEILVQALDVAAST
jgi:glutamate/tyrosine decarboxylase-like PLP-dependent enzyme